MSLVTRTPALFSSRLTFSLIFLLQLIYPWKAWCPLHPLPGSIADGLGLSFLTPPMGICTGSLCYSQVTCPCFHFLNANNCLPHSFFMVVHDRRMKGNGYELTQESFSLDKEKPSPHLVHVLKWQCFSLWPVHLWHFCILTRKGSSWQRCKTLLTPHMVTWSAMRTDFLRNFCTRASISRYSVPVPTTPQ